MKYSVQGITISRHVMDFKRYSKLGTTMAAIVLTCSDIILDVMLVGQYYDTMKEKNLFKYLTMLWIILGGIMQTIFVLRLLYNKDSSLNSFSWRVRAFVFMSAPFLMGPVAANLHGLYLIFCNGDNLEDEMLR